MKHHRLPSITLLPPPHDLTEGGQAVEDWARGLDWVRWLLGSVRARTEVLMAGDGSWEEFADGLWIETIGPALKTAWQAAQDGDLAGLIAVDKLLTVQLHPCLARRSISAGALLLKSTRRARYQAVLGRLREAVERGGCEGHIAVVWAAVGHFFQLSLANVIAEYLRLEWDIAVRAENPASDGTWGQTIARLTRRIMQMTVEGRLQQGEIQPFSAC